MLCYRCGSHVPDGSETCGSCGQSFAAGGLRQATGTFSRRRPNPAQVEGAPYKAGEVVAGRYQIRDCVGVGPVGYVFRAHDKEVEVEIALKLVSPKLVQTADERHAFARELKASRKLNHPNIDRIYEEGEYQDRPFYTAQFLDGLSLRKIIDLRKEKGQFFAVEEIEPILAQIAAALDEAHQLGLVHGDIKPENVLVLPDLLKVTDFGLGMAMPRAPFLAAQKTRKAERYFAPEFAQGDVSSAADIYALGAIMGEMLSGALPDGPEIPELRRINPAVTGQLEALYRRAVNANPQARFARAGALAQELALLAPRSGDDPDEVTPLSRPSPLTRETEPGRRVPARRSPPPPPTSDLAGGEDDREVTPALPRPPPPPVPDAPPPRLPKALPPPVPEEDDPTGPPTPPTERLEAQGSDATHVGPPPPPPARSRPGRSRRRSSSRSTWLVVVLGLLGVAAGIAAGYAYLAHEERRAEEEQRQQEAQRQLEQQRQRAEQARLREEQARRAQAADAGAPQAVLTSAAADAGASAVEPPPANPISEHRDDQRETRLAQRPGCPQGASLIPAGTFKMGSSPDDPLMGWDEKPLSTARTGAYCIDVFEYPDQEGTKPLTGVTFAQASAACESQGKRLCTEKEWERGCKGPANARFPFGETPDAKACNLSGANGNELAAAGSFSRCRSGYGLFDMAGNASEWTSSRYAPGASGKAVKGGGARSGSSLARCAGRRVVAPGSKESLLGFRCCADAK